MIQTIRSAWKVQELRNKLLFTIFALLIFRVGSAIPVPFIDTESLKTYMASQSSSIFGLLNVMSGDAFAQATVFALSIQPYINSSIIVQLLTIAIPALEKMARDEGEEGKKKIAAITRYATVAIALLQAFGYYKLISYYELVADGLWPAFVIIFAFTAGSAFLMWLGEQITEFGVGNGISIILFGGIIARGPHMVSSMINGVRVWASGSTSTTTASLHPAFIPLILVGILLLVVFVVFISNSERRVPVQYAKRVVGRKMYGGQSSHIPIKVNMSGVMPIIFAQAIASIPATIGMFVPSAQTEGSGWNTFLKVFDSNGLIYCVVYFLLIIVFSYFYNTIQFNPVEIANNLKKNGGFIPGIRPGKPTSDYIKKVLNKVTMFGAIYLSIVAVVPMLIGCFSDAPALSGISLGGTSIIIVVGVAIETVRAIEAQMLMRNYKGFLE